ncbi:hypothetical protein BK640_29310 [Pseudomonas protegens]|uniref:hypothetical protein n=1 Tax=Pseudomonas protegens TaxID=380021 RepID=UPI000F494D46|nr:hypothetical protein [Pseudomonas protegens]ROL86475.1 hypothetical protein BK639_28125 [Pseudomonas protegens]ROL95185.1 hypothetical protein BK640_29310 [Pseudomonas protegens]ROL97823.1 hypothetical protein BK641_26790 [Pseudomonas protegens]ROM07610.1 hypothetical protein BK642_13690 [Pseudomonas protegens]
MPQGLEVYDENGLLVIAVTDRITKILGSIDSGLSSGSLNVPELALGRPWVRAICYTNGTVNEAPAAVSLNGTVISWAFTSYNSDPPNQVRRNTKITYGVW